MGSAYFICSFQTEETDCLLEKLWFAREMGMSQTSLASEREKKKVGVFSFSARSRGLAQAQRVSVTSYSFVVWIYESLRVCVCLYKTRISLAQKIRLLMDCGASSGSLPLPSVTLLNSLAASCFSCSPSLFSSFPLFQLFPGSLSPLKFK